MAIPSGIGQSQALAHLRGQQALYAICHADQISLVIFHKHFGRVTEAQKTDR
jgi:hypothetical protein